MIIFKSEEDVGKSTFSFLNTIYPSSRQVTYKLSNKTLQNDIGFIIPLNERALMIREFSNITLNSKNVFGVKTNPLEGKDIIGLLLNVHRGDDCTLLALYEISLDKLGNPSALRISLDDDIIYFRTNDVNSLVDDNLMAINALWDFTKRDLNKTIDTLTRSYSHIDPKIITTLSIDDMVDMLFSNKEPKRFNVYTTSETKSEK